ncbi:MAG: hypothetical protein K0B52_04285, partial [FCB group bacterium]|nr:hypothetical protein [FCB group bacterium]
MKKTCINMMVLMLFTGTLYSVIPHSNRTWIRVGSLQTPIDAWGAERGHDANLDIYQGLIWPAWFSRSDNFVIDRQYMACRDFITPEGQLQGFKSTRFTTTADQSQLIPQMLEQVGKYPYCEITVDGRKQYYEDYLNENIEPDLPSDRIVTNIIRTGLGVTMTRTIYAFSQQYHDNYFIYEYTFENTGHINDDPDPKIFNEIKDFYFGRVSRYATSREMSTVANLRQGGWGAHQWVHHTPMKDDPPLPYYYTWLGQAKTSDISMDYDNIGVPVLPAEASYPSARIRSPQFGGMAVLHADKAWNNPNNDNNKVRLGWYYSGNTPPEGADQQVWLFLNDNYNDFGTFDVAQDEYAGHQIADRLAPYTVIQGNQSGTSGYFSFGPYDIPHGESVKVVI